MKIIIFTFIFLMLCSCDNTSDYKNYEIVETKPMYSDIEAFNTDIALATDENGDEYLIDKNNNIIKK